MTDRLVWIDCEMSGLELGSDLLLEVACVVTDSQLVLLDEGIDLVLAAPGSVLDAMVPVVAEMHARSGLTEAVRAASLELAEAEQLLLDYLRRFVPEPASAPLCGNSVATDRGFLARDMPALDTHLHYRMIDVSSIKELAKRWYPHAYQGAPVKRGGHRALADILESVRELAYYRSAVFVAPPGPDLATARGLAETIPPQAGRSAPAAEPS